MARGHGQREDHQTNEFARPHLGRSQRRSLKSSMYGYFVQEMRRNLKRLKEMRMDPKVNPVDLHQKIEEGVDGIESLTKLMVKVITTLRG